MKIATFQKTALRTTIFGLFLAFSFLFGSHPALAWNLQGSCTASPSTVNVGDTVTWSATQSSTMLPTEGHYEWVWSGDEGLTGTTQTGQKTYSTAGTKNATVIISMIVDSGPNSGLIEKVTAHCKVIVVTPPPQGSTFAATCSVSPTSLNIGETATWSATASGGAGNYSYSWSGTDGLTGTTQSVNKSYATVGTKTGTVVVTSGTETITPSPCTVVIQNPPVTGCTQNCGGGGCTSNCGGGSGGCSGNCGGGGLDQPTVVLLKKATTSGELAFVYLSQIPYTGLTDHWGLITFIIGLLLWSIAIAYFIQSQNMTQFIGRIRGMFSSVSGLSKAVQYDDAREPEFEVRSGDVLPPETGEESVVQFEDEWPDMNHDEIVSATSARPMVNGFVPVNLPTGNRTVTNSAEKDARNDLSRQARGHQALISDDALVIVVDKAHQSGVEPKVLLERVIKIAEEKFAKEDGWLLINKEKVSQALADVVFEKPKTYEETRLAFAETGTETVVVPKTFLLWVARGDTKKIFDHVRTLKQAGKDPSAFIKSVIYELDRVYRSRVDSDTLLNPELSHITSGWTNEQIEEMISILLTILEQSYKNSTVGLKLAVMRILDLKQFRS